MNPIQPAPESEKEMRATGGISLSAEKKKLLDIFKSIKLSGKKVDADKLMGLLEDKTEIDVHTEDEDWKPVKAIMFTLTTGTVVFAFTCISEKSRHLRVVLLERTAVYHHS